LNVKAVIDKTSIKIRTFGEKLYLIKNTDKSEAFRFWIGQ